MKAIVYQKYGLPDVLELKEVVKPIPKDDEVLIKIRAVSVNASDYEFLTGKPFYVRIWGILKPKYKILGSDVAGVIEAVGKNVKQFRPGEEVFGDVFGSWGGFAEYVCAHQDTVMLKPENMTFIQAATIPQAGVVALQGLRDKGKIESGQKVLINGAGGGAGTFAIQIAKLFGAEVTGVDNSEKLDMMRSIGADYVIDYTNEDYTQNGQRYDLILDLVAYRSIFDNKRVLSTNGIYVMVGGSVSSLFQTLIFGSLISKIENKSMGVLTHKQNRKDLDVMLTLFRTGKVMSVIDKCYPLNKTSDALRYLGEGHAKGKVVITL